MNAKRKYAWIPGLMIFSQSLLLAFVLYWLHGQYQEEKLNLHEKLRYDFIASGEEMIDSVLLKYIHPFLKDSNQNIDYQGFDFRVIGDSATDVIQTIDIVGPPKADRGAIISIQTEDSIFGTAHGAGHYEYVSESTKQDFVLRGVKLIMDISADSVGGDHRVMTKILHEPDTLLLQGAFKKRITQTTGRDLATVWVSDSLHFNTKNNLFVFNDGFLKEGPFLEVKNYQGLLLLNILPEAAFGLILLLLTAAAFFFTYRSLRRQLQLSVVRDEFISNISHELKTPVSTVKVALEAILRYDVKNDPEASNEYIRMAQAEMDRLDQLTQKVLVHSQLEHGEMGMERDRIDLRALVEEVLDKGGDLPAAVIHSGSALMGLGLRPGIGKIGEESEESEGGEEGEKYEVVGDKVYLEGVFMNLIDNAQKYAGDLAKIDIQFETDEKWVYVHVADNGPGIPEPYLRQVFDKFFRVPTANTHNVKGHGLGLSYTARVMEQHGGSIKVRNLDAGGCCFTLKFPRPS